MVKRVVDTKFWTDMKVMDHYSVEDKYFALYLMTNGKSTQVGIFSLPKKVISFETGFTEEVVELLLERFSDTYGKIVYSEKTQEVTLLDSLEFSVLRGGKPVKDLMERELTKVKDSELIKKTYEAMLDHWQKSKRPFDQTIRELFEMELTNRGLFHLQSQSQNQSQSHNHKHNQYHNHSHLHNQESQPTSRGTSRELDQTDVEDEELIERYSNYLKLLKPDLTKELDKENIVTVLYEELISEVSPTIKNVLKKWERTYPKAFILEAINRSVDARAPLAYADTILKEWEKHQAKDYRDILRLDQAHNQKKA